jgi:hypothetical protein
MYQKCWMRVGPQEQVPPNVRAAGEVLERAMQKKLHHRAAWAYVEMAARGGDQAALDLMELVGGLQ